MGVAVTMRLVLVCMAVEVVTGQVDLVQREMVGYDCTVPTQVEAVASAEDIQCDQPRQADKVVNATYRLLQRAEFLNITVKSCVMESARMAFFCGSSDHQTFAPSLSYFHKKKVVSVEECRQYWAEMKWRQPGRSDHVVQLKEGNNKFRAKLAGQMWVETNEVQCEGSWFQHGAEGGTHYMNVEEYWTLTLDKQQGLVGSDDGVSLPSMGRDLECDGKEGSCLTKAGTFTWVQPDSCRLFTARTDNMGEVKGLVTTTDTEWGPKTHFLSTDGSMIRLEMKEQISECGRVVTTTDYDKLFLHVEVATQATDSRLRRPLNPAEVSVVTYANQQDGFLLHSMQQRLRKELTSVMRHRCEEEEAGRKVVYARLASERRAALDGDTVALDNGWFATASGEAWIRYLCRPVTVRAMESDRCYSSMPVDLTSEDRMIFEREHYRAPDVIPERVARDAQGRTGLSGQPTVGLAEALEKGLRRSMMDWFPDIDNHRRKRSPRVERVAEVTSETGPSDQAEYFLEPHSHRLTQIGAPRECVANFAARYQNRHGQWLAAGPGLRLVAQPRLLHRNRTIPRLSAAWDPNVQGGGIYTKETIAQQERFLRAPRHQEDLGRKISNAAEVDATYLPNSGTLATGFSGMFGAMPTLGMAWLGKLWGAIDVWARIASILLLVGYTWALFKRASGACLRCWAVHDGYGCGPHLLAACCPNWFTVGGIKERAAKWARAQKAYMPTGSRASTARNRTPPGESAPCYPSLLRQDERPYRTGEDVGEGRTYRTGGGATEGFEPTPPVGRADAAPVASGSGAQWAPPAQ
jgi:hypothetical protein